MELRTATRAAYLIGVLGCFGLTACRTPGRQDVSRLRTDLGPQGNEMVARSFEGYKSKDSGCAATGTGKRVIVTGFGLFSNTQYNISGVVTQSMARDDFWPAPSTAEGPTPSTGTIRPEDFGGRAVNRHVVLDGQRYELCLVTLDVVWDLAAAIIVHEAMRFRPHLIIMTGRGGDADTGTLEAAALNQAMKYNGFASSGHALGELNEPVVRDSPILTPDATLALPPTIAMTWNNSRLAGSAQQRLANTRYRTVAAWSASPDNTYICNNVSYVVLNALQGRKLTLAGGLLTITPSTPLTAMAGFFHYPTSVSNSPTDVGLWCDVIGEMIRAQLN